MCCLFFLFLLRICYVVACMCLVFVCCLYLWSIGWYVPRIHLVCFGLWFDGILLILADMLLVFAQYFLNIGLLLVCVCFVVAEYLLVGASYLHLMMCCLFFSTCLVADMLLVFTWFVFAFRLLIYLLSWYVACIRCVFLYICWVFAKCRIVSVCKANDNTNGYVNWFPSMLLTFVGTSLLLLLLLLLLLPLLTILRPLCTV